MHGEALVGVGLGERAPGQQVVLVGRKGDPPADGGEEYRLPVLHRVDDGGGLLGRVRPHGALGRVAAHAQGHHAHGGQLRVLVEHPGEGVVEDRPVVDAGTHDHLAVDLDAGVEQGPQPAQAGGAPPVAQHPGPDLGVGGVDAHVDGAEALGDHPLEVELGEAGEGGVVAVEERQPVVVVLHVQAGAQALGQLVDEAELAVVVARADLVEQRRRHLRAQRLRPRPWGRAWSWPGRPGARRARGRPRRPAAATRSRLAGRARRWPAPRRPGGVRPRRPAIRARRQQPRARTCAPGYA